MIHLPHLQINHTEVAFREGVLEGMKNERLMLKDAEGITKAL